MVFKDKIINIAWPGLLLLVMVLSGCEKNRSEAQTGDDSYFYVTVKAASSINQDKVSWEDRVDELRMMVFEIGSGDVVFNEPLYFPNGFGDKSRPVMMTPGTYDFCFIANESAYAGDFVTALMEVANRSDLYDDPRFRELAYRPDFIPDATSRTGRFVMSAIYDGITVASGGTEANPVSLMPPGSKVELIRPLAKVEVIFRKKVPGASVPEGTIGAVRLDNVASVISVPPFDDYYAESTQFSDVASTAGFRYDNDSIGAVTFYIPELLVPEGGGSYTEINIDNRKYPVRMTDGGAGLVTQRRNVPALSENSVVRNYHYVVNANVSDSGVMQLEVHFQPWTLNDKYTYMFVGDEELIIPPIEPTDSSIVMPTDCGLLEIMNRNEALSGGLAAAYNHEINWGAGEIVENGPPYYCEQKYGPGWRLINLCELMNFLALCDGAYRVWTSNTWDADGYITPFPIVFRQQAQTILEQVTGLDLSGSDYKDGTVAWEKDGLVNSNLSGFLWAYFVPGDVMVRADDFPGGWPFQGVPGTGASESWVYNEMTIFLKAFWESGYVTLTNRSNWDKVMYRYFFRYDYSSTTSRCVRSVEE